MQIPSIAAQRLDYKHQVADHFGHAVSTYNYAAIVQQDCAKGLVKILQDYCDQIPPGVILEVGCGTGFITQELVNYFPDHPLEITDISLDMLEFCQRHLHFPSPCSQPISFQVMDGESLSVSSANYAAIASGFVIQWFEHPVKSLQKMTATLKPGGILVVSFPSDRSFPEWRQMCQQLDLPFTANILPNVQELCQQLVSNSIKCIEYEKKIVLRYKNAIAFFKSLKLIGAGLNRSNRALSPRQMKQLIRYWDQQHPDGIEIQYHIAFLIIQNIV
jgi:malonyl-CoA O-methyltransferase